MTEPVTPPQLAAEPSVTRGRWVVILALGLVALCSLLVAAIVWLVFQNSTNVEKISVRQANVCDIVIALDPIIAKTAEQTRAALADGSYSRLVKKGVLTEKQVQDARDNLKLFDKAHDLLQARACAL